MSTLAKIVKKHAGPTFTRFSVPVVGEIEMVAENNSNFEFPMAEFLPVVDVPEELSKLDVEDPEEEIDVVEAARTEAALIIGQAERDREMIEQAAREKGMQFAQSKIDEEVRVQMDEMRTQLTATIEQIAGLNAEITAGSETQLVELAIEIARKIVAREVTIDREIALTLVKVSLKRINSRTAARIHLHPDDFAFVQSHRERLDFHGSLEFVEDRSITIGGCLVRTETGDIDARIESQFDEIAHGLLGV